MRDARPCPVFYGLPMTKIFSFFVLSLFAVPAAADTLVGQATIVDGDTVRMGGKTVHLYGIDAPEMDQFCIDKRGNQLQLRSGLQAETVPIYRRRPAGLHRQIADAQGRRWRDLPR